MFSNCERTTIDTSNTIDKPIIPTNMPRSRARYHARHRASSSEDVKDDTPDGSDDELYTMPSPRKPRAPSHRSDKENVPDSPFSDSNARKKARMNGTGGLHPTQAMLAEVLEEQGNLEIYDPDQSPEERRKVRKGYRQLQRKLDGSRSEFLNPENNGLHDIFIEADSLFKNVKQTSDATLDSRLLVAASDLALKKVSNMVLGSASAGVDVDEFVAKCMAFMRSANRAESDEEEHTDDALDWAHFGRTAAFRGSKRPPTSDFLHGPLSVQKKIRVQKTRRQGLGRRRGEEATKPVEVNAEDIKQSENNTLKLVRKVYDVLLAYFVKHDLEESGVNLFSVVVNPESFGQTIENIFFVSFLAREGKIAIQDDDNGLPMLYIAEPATEQQHASGEVKRQQMIFPMTMWDWKQLIGVFDISNSVIPTREKENLNVGVNG